MVSIQKHAVTNHVTDNDLAVYVSEIRQRVCKRCPQQVLGGPPCALRGILCGVELHLPLLIDAIDSAHVDDRQFHLPCRASQVCEGCAFEDRSPCPCAVQRFSVSLPAAVRAVGKIVKTIREKAANAPWIRSSNQRRVRAVYQVYRLAAGTWTGCDWPTRFSPSRLDLNDWPSLGAAIMADRARSAEQRRHWRLAARWLAHIEERAKRAELFAGLAVAAANTGQWPEARRLSAEAWALESSTGRPFFRGLPPAWQRLAEMLEAAAAHRPRTEPVNCDEDPRASCPARWPLISISAAFPPQAV